MVENFDPNTIEDESLRQVVITLMNLVETLSAKVKEQAEEIQRLRDCGFSWQNSFFNQLTVLGQFRCAEFGNDKVTC